MARRQNQHIQPEAPENDQSAEGEPARHHEQVAVDTSFRAPKDKRVRKKYRIPNSARFRDTDPHYVIVRELTVDEMDEAAKIAAASSGRKLGTEMAKLGMEAVSTDPSGKTGWRTLDHSAAEHEGVWDRLTNKVKVLVAQAVQRLNSSSDEEDEAFFGSEEDV